MVGMVSVFADDTNNGGKVVSEGFRRLQLILEHPGKRDKVWQVDN